MSVKKPIIINAFHGLGDIIFSIPIYRRLIADGHTVIHPYLPEYGNLWRHWPEITWVQKDQLRINYDNRATIETDAYKIIPLRWANNIMHGKDDTTCMRAKYDFMGLDYWDWQTVTWNRDMHSEEMLMQELGINPGEKYAIINNTFLHNFKGKIRINIPKGVKIIELKKTGNYTLLDWGKVLENASEIHTVGTSINYMIDPNFLNITCPVHVYKREPKEQNHNNYNYLMRREYIWH